MHISTLLVALQAAGLAAAEDSTGKVRWQLQTANGDSADLGSFGKKGDSFFTADLNGSVKRYDTTKIKRKEPSEVWSYKIPDTPSCSRGIYTKPVFDSAESGIVVGTFIPPDSCTTNHAGGFYKIDAETGKELWNFQLNGFVWTSAAMALNDTAVYAVAEDAFGSGDGRMYAFDYATGEELWNAAVLGSEGFFPAFLGTPIVGEDGSAYVGSENTDVYVINKNGERIFDYTTGSTGSTVGTPLLAVDEANGRLLVTTNDQSGNLKQQAFDLSDDGKFAELWAFEPDRQTVGYGGNRVPAVVGGDVVMAFVGEYLFGLDGASGDELWKVHADGNQATDIGNVPPLVDAEGKSVFVCSYNSHVTNFTSLNVQDGSVNWQNEYQNEYNAQCFGYEAAEDATASALVYCMEASTLRVFAADGGEEQWNADTLGYTPLLDNNHGAAKCDGGYHMCTDFGPPSSSSSAPSA